MDIDMQSLTDEDLEALIASAAAEQARRRTLAEAETMVAQADERWERDVASVAASYLAARDGNGEPKPWVQPTGAHDAYPLGWVTTHNGKTWVSLIANNAHEPGVSGWREEVEDGGVAEWVQPSGAHDAYMTGAVVTHDGKTWISTVDSNVWEPGVYGWEEYSG